MKLIFEISYAVNQLKRNKVRAGLTLLGMVIGVASIIVVFSAGEGIKSLVLAQVEAFGTDFIEVEIKIPTSKKGMKSEQQNAAALAQGVQVTTLTLEDMDEIAKIPNVKASYSGIMSQEQVGYRNEAKKAIVFGTNSDYIDIDKSEVEYGRFFSDSEDKSYMQVAVLGSKIKESLFGDSDPIGKYVSLHKTKFLIIGVIKERGAVMTMDFDNYVYVPIRTLQKKIMGINHVMYSIFQLHDMDFADETAEEMRAILRENHDIAPVFDEKGDFDVSRDDFRVVTMEEMMDMLGIITNALTLLLIAIVAVSLVVGGVGVMNIMYVIVSERTSEIGLRKAVGARESDIMRNFLLESVTVTFIGSVIGALLGSLISLAIFLAARSYFSDWNFALPWQSFLTTLVFSLVFGIAFGLYPARKAARMDPIEALRSE